MMTRTKWCKRCEINWQTRRQSCPNCGERFQVEYVITKDAMLAARREQQLKRQAEVV